MDDATNPEVPEVDTSLPVDDSQADQTTLDEYGNPVEPEPQDHGEEIEHEGKKFRVPKELKDSFLMHRDYTQKTQGLSLERQAFEAERTSFREASAAEVNAHANIIAIDQALKDFQSIDWRTWFARDPAAAQAAKLDYDEMKERRAAAVGKYQEANQTRVAQEQRATAERMRQGHAELVRAIPGWNQDKASAIVDFGQKAFGFSAAEMHAISDPRMIKVLNAALEHHKATSQQKTAQQIQAQQAVKPASTVKGGGSAPKPLDDRASTDDWMKARQKQLAARR